MKEMERKLGLWSVVGISSGAMLGSGLFVLPGLAAELTGPSLWLAYLVAGLCVLPAALAKSELATAMPVSGGTYFYLDRAFGPFMGTISGVGLWMSLLLKSSFALIGFGAYLDVLTDLPLRPLALILLAAIVVLNVLGVKKVGKVQVVMVVLAVAGLVSLALLGLTRFESHFMRPFFSAGSAGFLATVGFVYVSFAGVTKVAAIAEEVRDPGRNLPRGILISLAGVTALYCLITFVLAGTLGPSLAGDIRPIYSLALSVGGPVLGVAAAVLGVLTLTSMANSGLLAASRFPFAMSRDDLLPRRLAQLHPRFMTPISCVLITALAMAAAIIFLDVAKIAKLASSLKITAFILANLALVVLRESGSQWYKPRYRAPLYPWLQIFGILTGLALLVSLGVTGLAALLAMSVPGALLYAAYGRHRADRRSVFGAAGPRREILVEVTRPEELHLEDQDTAVVVPLFGRERSPETLVEMAISLADGRRVEVVRILPMPEQTVLDTRLEEKLMLASLRRRIEGMNERPGVSVHFDSVVSHDVVVDVHAIATRTGCDWLLMEWRRSESRLTIFDPLGWLVNHLPCNLALYKDAGVRNVQQIMALGSPGPHDALVVSTVQHLAEDNDASATFVSFVDEDVGDAELRSETDYLEELTSLYDGEAASRIVRGENDVASLALVGASYDLLVMGAPRDLTLWDHVVGTPEDRLMSRVNCSVLRIKTPPSRTHEMVAPAPRDASSIEGLLDDRALAARVAVDRREALFPRFAEAFAPAVGSPPAEVEAVLIEREKTQTTAVGRGVALPHGTLPGSDGTHLGIFTLEQPIDCQAPDDEPVDVFFVTLGPPSARGFHLELLATIARLIDKTALLERLRRAESSSELRRALRASEDELRSKRKA